MQLTMHSIENKLQQEVSIHPQKRLAESKHQTQNSDNTSSKFRDNSSGNTISNSSSDSAQQVAIKIINAINANDYFNASYLINTLANEYDAEIELSKVKLFWLKATKALIQQGFFEYADNSISAYLTYEADDNDFLYQQVDLYWQQQIYLSAIKYAYEMQYHVFNEIKKRDVISFARGLVLQQVDRLIKNGLWLELREFVEQVIIFDPDDLHLQWLFVRAQYQLGEFDYALNAIEPLLSQPNYKIKAQALFAKIEAALRKPESIPLSRQGEHFIVEAFINESFNVSLMLDTGASISLLSESAFEALSRHSDVTYLKDLKLNTAGGQVTASIYQVAEFSIQGYRVNDFVFAVSPFVSEGNDGLLGMNFLRAFDFHIDQNNNSLMLKNK